MQQLLSQLGIDWHLLISQAVNFFLLVIVLRLVAYKPLMKLIADRRARIEEGLMKADEADKRLLEVDEISKKKVKEAELQAMGIVKKTEDGVKAIEEKMMAEAKRKEAEAMRQTEQMLRSKEEESRRGMEREAAELVRQVIVKTVELSPKAIDDALIAKAMKEVKQAS